MSTTTSRRFLALEPDGWDAVLLAFRTELVMISTAKAREIAAGWISPSPRDVNLTAFATGHPRWTSEGLADEVRREFAKVVTRPQNYDNATECQRELRELLEYAEGTDYPREDV